jgi:hypothetical protein
MSMLSLIPHAGQKESDVETKLEVFEKNDIPSNEQTDVVINIPTMNKKTLDAKLELLNSKNFESFK